MAAEIAQATSYITDSTIMDLRGKGDVNAQSPRVKDRGLHQNWQVLNVRLMAPVPLVIRSKSFAYAEDTSDMLHASSVQMESAAPRSMILGPL